jgi:hypothetical protein
MFLMHRRHDVPAGRFVEQSGMTEFPRFKRGVLHPHSVICETAHLATISWFGVPARCAASLIAG